MKSSEQYYSSNNNEEIKTDKTPPNDSIEFNWELHKKDIKNITEPIVERIPDDDYEYILHSWEISPTVGNQALASIMSEAMGIQLPTIIENNSIDSIGGYVFGRNQIVLNRVALKENLHEIEEEDKMAEHELGTIAHEMWHAFQEDCVRKNTERAGIYKKGINDYKDCKGAKNDDEFWSQVLELEAEYFAFLVRKKIEALKYKL